MAHPHDGRLTNDALSPGWLVGDTVVVPGNSIVVCGCIAAGKTTAVGSLSTALEYLASPQDYASNLFLQRFYDDPRRWALPSQMYFVLESLRREAHGVRGVIRESDTMLTVEVMSRELHARGWLGDDEMGLVEDAASLGCGELPDLYVHLRAGPTALLERIAKRGRAMERDIERDYLQALTCRYETVLADVSTNVLSIDTDRLEICTPVGLEQAVALVREAL